MIGWPRAISGVFAVTQVSSIATTRLRVFADHALLITFTAVMGGPLLLLLFGATRPGGLQSSPSPTQVSLLSGLKGNLEVLASSGTNGSTAPTIWNMLITSMITASGVALIATAVGFLAAYAMTFLLTRGTRFLFGLTLLTLYFPVEARMLPTFDVVLKLGLINSFTGLILPILPLALSTFVFYQHMKTMPPQLLEAARLDGAGPIRFLVDFVVPLSWLPICAVFLIAFLVGWNQYLWPLMISIDNAHFPLMRGLNLFGAGSGPSMVLASIAILPPFLLVIAFMRLLSRVSSIHL